MNEFSLPEKMKDMTGRQIAIGLENLLDLLGTEMEEAQYKEFCQYWQATPVVMSVIDSHKKWVQGPGRGQKRL